MGPGLVRVSDSRGGVRGLAFGVDRDGTLVTAHEVVDGLSEVLLGYPDGSSVRVPASGIVPLPEHGLALLRAAVPAGGPWPVGDGVGTRLVSVPGPGVVLQGAVAGLVTARYEASERFWLLPDVWQLGLEQAPYGLPLNAAGGPVVDAETGAVVGVATAALRSRRRGAVLAVRLGAVAGEPALADVLARNAETVPAHGRALNLAGVLELTAAGIDAAATEAVARRVPRADGVIEAVQGWDPVRPVLAVVGEAGSGRTTELAALALHRTRAAFRLPTLWLRGADLEPGDTCVLDAADRALARVHTLLRHQATSPLAGHAARVAAAAHRPLLITLDSPEEAPASLLSRWAAWCTESARRLRATESRLLLGCLPEFWHRTAAALSPDDIRGAHWLGPLDAQASWTLALGADAAPGAASAGLAGAVGAGFGASARAGGEAGFAASGHGTLAGAGAAWSEGGLSRVAGAGPVGPEPCAPGPGEGSGFAASGHGPFAGTGAAWPGAGLSRLAGAGPVGPASWASGPGDGSGFAWPTGGPSGGVEPAVVALVGAGDGLALRELARLRAAQPALVLPRARPLARAELLAAGLDLACLDIAQRLVAHGPSAARPVPLPGATGGGAVPGSFVQAEGEAPRGLGHGLGILWWRAVPEAQLGVREPHAATTPAGPAQPVGAREMRRLAARVAGRCHEAARRMLGAADGGLTARQFDELFPWQEGWAQAALGEGLFVAAGAGYRFASGALAEWLQGFHLDLPAALTVLLAEQEAPAGAEPSEPRPVGAHRRGGPVGWAPPVPVPGRQPGGGVPRWRISVVRQALLALATSDPQTLESLLSRLVLRLDGPEAAAPGTESHWWAERLLTTTLERLPDAAPYAPLLRALAARVVYATNATDATRTAEGSAPEPFLAWDFWRGLPLTVADRLDVLRVLARAAAAEPGRLIGEVITRHPAEALPPLCLWLADERVSGVAAETLFAHRHVDLDALAEALVDAAHPRADALLRALAQAEPSALCRAVDRWAHDARPERHVAAATVLPLVACHAVDGAPAERTLVRLAAEAVLARADEEALHGAAYAALVRDPAARARHLPGAVARYLAGDPLLGAADLAPALDSDPLPVLSGYAGRLREPGEEAAAVLRALGATPAPHTRAAAARLVLDHLRRRPEAAAQVGAWMRARLAHGEAERETLRAFARDVAAEQPDAVRLTCAAALADVPQDAALDAAASLAAELRALLSPGVTSPMRIGGQAHGKV